MPIETLIYLYALIFVINDVKEKFVSDFFNFKLVSLSIVYLPHIIMWNIAYLYTKGEEK